MTFVILRRLASVRFAALALVVVGLCMAGLWGMAPAHAARKAFIVGNSTYAGAPHLPNPANDARDLAARLETLGYRITLGVNLTRSQFLSNFQGFVRSLASDDVALIYFAGHGLQIGGENYLFPIDTKVDSEADARGRLVALNALIAEVSRATRTRVVILDACRNNPFGEKLAQSQPTRSAGLSSGLARVYAGVGSFIAYSTQPGNVALDGDGRNSPFTEALLRHMSEPGADVHAVMRRVRADVQRATSQQQVPWENSSLIDEMSFAATTPPLPSATPSQPPPPPGPTALATPPPERKPSPNVARGDRQSESFSYVTGLDPNGDNFLALRSRPGTEGTRIATLGPDTLVTVLERRGDWRRIELTDGISGWAHGKWISCCRTLTGEAVSQASGATAPQARPQPAAADTCDTLWVRRNAIWHRHGYCFSGLRGQQVFGNQGCSRDQAEARAAMSPADRSAVDALATREKQMGCR